MKQIIKRYLDIIYNEAGIIKSGVAKTGSLETGHELAFDGTYWKYNDLDPTSSVPSYWDGLTFVSRLRGEIASCGNLFDPGSEKGYKILSAINYWLDNDFTNPNWWHNQIGIPSNISDICLMLAPYLNKHQTEKMLEIISRGSMKCCPAIRTWTGANLIWGVWTSIRHALLTSDSDFLRESVSLAARELRVTPSDAEGIKRDGGFFQHGPQLYSGGYGRSFTNDIATIAYILSGSEYQFSSRELNTLNLHVLDGQRLLSCGDSFDFNVIGREISRNGALGLRNSLLPALKRMCATDEIPRKAELSAYVASIEEAYKGDFYVVKYFECIKYLIIKRSGYYIGIHGNSYDISGGESINGENALSYNLTYGSSMCMMTDGGEYIDALPVWDYSMIPGTTAVSESDNEISMHNGWSGRRGASNVCGGTSNGIYGVMYFDCKHDVISMKLTYIAYPGGVIVLANDINIAESDKFIFTTLDQSSARSPMYHNAAVYGETVIHSGETVTNNNFVFRRLDGGEMTARVAAQSGSWFRNNKAEDEAVLTKPIFTLFFKQNKCESDSYAYSVEFKEVKNAPEIRRVKNEKNLSVVEFTDGVSIVVMREEDEYKLSDGNTIRGKGAYINMPGYLQS